VVGIGFSFYLPASETPLWLAQAKVDIQVPDWPVLNVQEDWRAKMPKWVSRGMARRAVARESAKAM
jgi:hypothetical protein